MDPLTPRGSWSRFLHLTAPGKRSGFAAFHSLHVPQKLFAGSTPRTLTSRFEGLCISGRGGGRALLFFSPLRERELDETQERCYSVRQKEPLMKFTVTVLARLVAD